MRYKPWGEVRSWWTAGLSTTPAYELSNYTFTGQYSYLDDPSTAGVTEGFGLMFYNARWYDPALGRFAQADTIVPPGVQGWDRYAAMNNNPIRYLDPSGHVSCSSVAEEDCSFETMSAVEVLKRTIKSKYGITMSEESDPNNLNPKTWSLENLRIIYNALGTIDAALNGKLKSLVGGATFKWGEHDPGGGTK
jgi:RHS repeat-associated protein